MPDEDKNTPAPEEENNNPPFETEDPKPEPEKSEESDKKEGEGEPEKRETLWKDGEHPKPEPKKDDPNAPAWTHEDLKVAEEATAVGVDVVGLSKLSQELGLDQEGTQSVLDFHTSLIGKVGEAVQAEAAQLLETWQQESLADPEIGGPKFQEAQKNALDAIHTLGTPKFQEVLFSSGLHYNVEVIRVFANLGKRMQNDQFIFGKASAPAKPVQDRLFPSTVGIEGEATT